MGDMASPATEALAVRDIRVAFGGVTAVDGVSFTVGAGHALAVIGPNGSGKTTLLNAVGGLLAASGTVELNGRLLERTKPVALARAGIARTFQTPQVIDHLSCLDNVLLASADQRSRGLAAAWIGRPAMMRAERDRWRAGSASLARFGLGEMAEVPASRLTYGQRRWLELARVAVAQPRYLLADEPSAGLNDAETDELAAHLRSFCAQGVGVVLVDHKVDFLRAVADSAIVLALGRLVAEAPIDRVWDLPEVQVAYLGSRRVDA